MEFPSGHRRRCPVTTMENSKQQWFGGFWPVPFVGNMSNIMSCYSHLVSFLVLRFVSPLARPSQIDLWTFAKQSSTFPTTKGSSDKEIDNMLCFFSQTFRLNHVQQSHPSISATLCLQLWYQLRLNTYPDNHQLTPIHPNACNRHTFAITNKKHPPPIHQTNLLHQIQ